MRYAKLSSTEFYSCYLQRCHKIDLFSYRAPGHGQKGHMNKGCPSFYSEVFMELALQFFSETQHGSRNPCGVVYDRKKCFTPKMRKIDQTQGSLNVQGSSGFFLSSLFFYQCGLHSVHPPFLKGGQASNQMFKKGGGLTGP